MKLEKHQKWRKSFPYYKMQYWSKIPLAWQDVQFGFSSLEEARRYADNMHIKRYRVMEIQRTNRRVIYNANS